MHKRNSQALLYNQDLIDQLPGLFYIVDLESKFLHVNNVFTQWTGFKSCESLIDRTYTDMRCRAAERHLYFKEQDHLAIASMKPVTILAYVCYAHDWLVVFGEKYPLKSPTGELLGIVSHFRDITKYHLIDLYRFLNVGKTKNLIPQQQIEYILAEYDPELELSPRQSQCLFFLLRGKSYKEIAHILNISTRTSEGYITEIKTKLNCVSKSELIDLAISKGYMNIIPKGMLNELI